MTKLDPGYIRQLVNDYAHLKGLVVREHQITTGLFEDFDVFFVYWEYNTPNQIKAQAFAVKDLEAEIKKMRSVLYKTINGDSHEDK